MARLPPIILENLSPDQRVVHDRIVSGPRGAIDGPLWVWLRDPALADKAQSFGAFCRFGTKVAPRLIEIAVLTTASYWRAGFEWAVHAPAAAQQGLSPQVIEALRRGEAPEFELPEDQVVYGFCRELLINRRVPEDRFAQLERLIGAEAMIQLVGILGYYALISMTIVAFEVPLPRGAKEPFADLPERASY